jgi:hypothetical protein
MRASISARKRQERGGLKEEGKIILLGDGGRGLERAK